LKKAIMILSIILTLLMILPVLSRVNNTNETKNVLVIHSYHKGLSWTDEFQRGIEEELQLDHVEIMVEYMDCYRYHHPSYYEELFNFYLQKYNHDKIDVVIITDNNAYDFLKLYHDQLFVDVPIVFAGVNNFTKEDLFHENITGIVQNAYQEEMINLILSLDKDIDTILLSGSNSATAIADAEVLIRVGESKYKSIRFDSMLTETFEEQIEAIKLYGTEVAIIASGTMRDKNGIFLDHTMFSSRLIEETGKPVYAMATAYIVEGGAIGGVAADSYVDGKIAANYAAMILKGKAISELPIIEDPKAYNIFDYNRLKQFNIDMDMLPEDSIILNGPSMKLLVDKKHVNLVVIVIVLMGILIIGFIANSIRQKKAERIIMETKRKLRQNNFELEASNKFLLDSKEKLNKQFDELAEKNAHIEFLAYYDSLTRLMKRDMLCNTLSEIIEANNRESFCIYDIDIINLKTINDTYGHDIGNEVLSSIAKKLASCYKGDDFLFGAHHSEFIVVDFSVIDIEEMIARAQEFISCIKSDFKIKNKEIELEIGIGISGYPIHGKDATSLLKNANIALLEANKNGKNTVCLYQEIFYDNIMNRLNLEKQLKMALVNEEFELFYQPKIDTNNCDIVGCEALIRWHHPDGSLVFPGKFIDIAEESGLIIDIGEWVIMQACRQIKEWKAMGIHLTVSVNVSARQLIGSSILDVVKNAISTYNIDPKLLELEITESVMMQDIGRNAKIMDELKKLNIGIALDDFGTGYSSMSYIKELPLTKLKIDKSFIDNIEEKAQREIIKSIIVLGQALNFIINIEGVERAEQFKILQEYKADEVQGFLFSKAIPKDEIPKFIESFNHNFKHLY